METALERLVEVLEALLSLEERLDATTMTGTRRPTRQEGEHFITCHALLSQIFFYCLTLCRLPQISTSTVLYKYQCCECVLVSMRNPAFYLVADPDPCQTVPSHKVGFLHDTYMIHAG